MSDIREFYNAGWDGEDDRLTRHQLEADLTRRYLDQYLPSGGRILEIGCGTGSYTFALAKRGYRLTAVDLADEFVIRCRATAEVLGLSGRIDFRTADARSLDGVPRENFDAVLLMGPLYHLVLETDRSAALCAARGCLSGPLKKSIRAASGPYGRTTALPACSRQALPPRIQGFASVACLCVSARRQARLVFGRNDSASPAERLYQRTVNERIEKTVVMPLLNAHNDESRCIVRLTCNVVVLRMSAQRPACA